ncbi:MAG: choline-binding protein, partial [Bacilli bacterium]|nr:choline-binding protein [Bacilli bacterium]
AKAAHAPEPTKSASAPIPAPAPIPPQETKKPLFGRQPKEAAPIVKETKPVEAKPAEAKPVEDKKTVPAAENPKK